MKIKLFLSKSEALEAAGTNLLMDRFGHYKITTIDDRTKWEGAGKHYDLIPDWGGELPAVEDEEDNLFAWFYDDIDDDIDKRIVDRLLGKKIKVTIKVNDIPFDEQIISRSLLRYAINDDFDFNALIREDFEAFEETFDEDFYEFNEELSSALADFVRQHYGDELGDAFRGFPDNANGIWFEGADVDRDTRIEINDKCHELANDVNWLNKNISETIVECEF